MKHTALAVFLAATFCNLALAAEPSAYISTGVGSAEQKLSIDDLDVSKRDTAFQIAAGYQFSSNAGVELGYTYLGKAAISSDDATVSSKPQAFHLAVTGTWNASPSFAVTGKLGAARTRTRLEASVGGFSTYETETRSSPTFGIGARYKFEPDFAATLEYQNFGKIIKGDGADLKAHVVLVGIRYSF
jgi:OOP family OmpA-OmpF porin